MANPISWNSPQLPDDNFEDDDVHCNIRAKIDELATDDAPSSSDTAMILQRYYILDPHRA